MCIHLTEASDAPKIALGNDGWELATGESILKDLHIASWDFSMIPHQNTHKEVHVAAKIFHHDGCLLEYVIFSFAKGSFDGAEAGLWKVFRIELDFPYDESQHKDAIIKETKAQLTSTTL